METKVRDYTRQSPRPGTQENPNEAFEWLPEKYPNNEYHKVNVISGICHAGSKVSSESPHLEQEPKPDTRWAKALKQPTVATGRYIRPRFPTHEDGEPALEAGDAIFVRGSVQDSLRSFSSLVPFYSGDALVGT